MTTPATETKKRPIDEARERLKLLSLEVKDLVEDETFYTINDAIVETLYKDETHREFKSYRQWKKEGKQVRKGEKAFLLWARPKQIQKPIAEAPPENLEEMIKYFPIAYLFSNAQVDPIDGDDETQTEQGEPPKPQTSPTAKAKPNLEPLEY
ncbi:ArdC-like ssDNA-binding domain-containing protein [Oscillatoria amoena NRMC-F 0135]|nr:ArdC-like ssDNA-binding domain-containing protein [Oscillatoria amoena NRMC-F 0135]